MVATSPWSDLLPAYPVQVFRCAWAGDIRIMHCADTCIEPVFHGFAVCVLQVCVRHAIAACDRGRADCGAMLEALHVAHAERSATWRDSLCSCHVRDHPSGSEGFPYRRPSRGGNQ